MILDDFNLHDKVAIVTGCNTGLGQGMAIGLAQAGCDIVAVNRTNPTETKQIIEQLGRKFLNISADLSKQDSLPEIVEQASNQFGKIDILVNNAGIIRRQNALEFTEKDWDDVLDTNLKTVFFLSQAVARQFIKQKSQGKIINVASLLSFQGGIRVASYTAAKGGVVGITKLLANEWAKYHININAIAPGYMVSNNTHQLREDPKRSQEILERIPANRWGVPEDLMGPVVFLASSASDYVNGFTLAVDGGWLAR